MVIAASNAKGHATVLPRFCEERNSMTRHVPAFVENAKLINNRPALKL